MQSLRKRTNCPSSSLACADEVLACIPAVMRFIRREMRGHRGERLSVPQFRALIFARLHEGASLSALAEHLGLSLPTASRMADQLVRRGLLERRPGTADRRRVALRLTRRGARVYEDARRATRAAIARELDALADAERRLVGGALRVLGRVFAGGAPLDGAPARPNVSMGGGAP